MSLLGCDRRICTCPRRAYTIIQEEFQHYADELFQLVRDGHVRLARFKEDGYDFTTESIRQAHRDISSRGTTGKLLVKIA